MWFERRRDWWREALSSVKILICFRLLLRRLLRLVFVCCVLFRVSHFDAEQAFVQSSLDEDVFKRLPPGCGEMSGRIVRLNRSFYGLKLASRSWHISILSPT